MQIVAENAGKPLRKLHRAIQSATRNSTPEHVHDLRTGSRRAEAVIEVALPDTPKRVRRSLARIRRRAGKVRDMDVMIGLAATLNDGSQDDYLVRLIEELSRRRFRKARKLSGILAEEQKYLLPWLKESAREVDRMIPASADSVNADPTRPTTALQLLSRWPQLTRFNLHEFRIQSKNLYYMMELAPNQNRKLERTLKQVKDTIGEWHDWSEMAAFSERVFRHHGRCAAVRRILRRIQSVAQKKFTRAMAQARSARTVLTKAARSAG